MTANAEADPLRSPSEATRRWLASKHWHPITWLMVIAGLLHLVGDLVMAASMLAHAAARDFGSKPLADVLAEILHMIGYSLWFFGTAATVEFLYRIWGELRLRRPDRQAGALVTPPSPEL